MYNLVLPSIAQGNGQSHPERSEGKQPPKPATHAINHRVNVLTDSDCSVVIQTNDN